MAEDFRQRLVEEFSELLVSEFGSEQVDFATRKLIKALDSYEVSERSTEIIPYDDENERIIRRYLACLVVDGKSAKTVNAYRRAIVAMLNTIHKNVTNIGTYDLRYYLACEKDRGVSNRSLENYRAYLSSFFQWLSAEEIIEKNPCARIKPIKFVKEVRKPFSDTDIDAIRFACANKKQRAIVELLLSSGVRVNEMVNMQISDIDFDKMSVLVRNGKGGKQRTTYINDVAALHIKKYLSERTENGPYLFYNKNHEQLATNGVRFILRGLGEKAGVEDVHPHRFRRTFATNLAKRGMGVQEIRVLLGHSDINTTLEYVCVNVEVVSSSYKKYIS